MMRHSAATVLLVCASAGLSWVAVGAPTLARAEIAAETEPCSAWPGEIDPLPRVDSADPISARWARKRAESLAADARLVETVSLQEARLHWRHVLCLDPYSDAGRAGMFRTGPFRVSGPIDIEPAGPPQVSGSPRVARAADDLDAGELDADDLDADELAKLLNPGRRIGDTPATPGAVTPSGTQYASHTDATPPHAAQPAPAPRFISKPAPIPSPEESALRAETPRRTRSPYDDFVQVPPLPDWSSSQQGELLTAVDQELGEIATLVSEAHFHTALSIAGSTRGLLISSPPADAVNFRRARLEVLAATAAVALGRDQDALVSMSDALRANPELQLDTATTSPKVVAILDEARRSPRPPRLTHSGHVPLSQISDSTADIGAVQ